MSDNQLTLSMLGGLEAYSSGLPISAADRDTRLERLAELCREALERIEAALIDPEP